MIVSLFLYWLIRYVGKSEHRSDVGHDQSVDVDKVNRPQVSSNFRDLLGELDYQCTEGTQGS